VQRCCLFLLLLPSPSSYLTINLDMALSHQLKQYKKSIISLGWLWQKDSKPFLASSEWPTEILSCPPSFKFNPEAEDHDRDLDEFSPLPDSVFMLDDRHAAFLEAQAKAEEDDVERMLHLVDQREELKPPS
jgi:hypothetical protein